MKKLGIIFAVVLSASTIFLMPFSAYIFTPTTVFADTTSSTPDYMIQRAIDKMNANIGSLNVNVGNEPNHKNQQFVNDGTSLVQQSNQDITQIDQSHGGDGTTNYNNVINNSNPDGNAKVVQAYQNAASAYGYAATAQQQLDAAETEYDNCYVACDGDKVEQLDALATAAIQNAHKAQQDAIAADQANKNNDTNGLNNSLQNTANDRAATNGNSIDAAKTGAPDTNACWVGVGSGFFNIPVCIQQIVAWFAYLSLKISAFVLGLIGYLFNKVLQYTVLNMKVDLPTGIVNAWTVFRDLANIIFIFVLLYLAVSTILGNMSGRLKQVLGKVIIIGLLLNFSLFFTQAIIDASNILTLGFYNLATSIQITTPAGQTGAASTNNTDAGFSNYGMAGEIMQSLGLSTLYKDGLGGGSTQTTLNNGGYQTILFVGFGGSIFVLITAFTLAIATWLFIVRFIVLIILMILSPLAFVLWTLPAGKSTARKWGTTLIGQCIFAPLYMGMFWVVFLLLQGFAINGDFSSLLQSGGTQANIGVLMDFLMIILLLNLAVTFAKSYASQGSSYVAAATKWGTNKISNAAATVRTKALDAGRATAGAATLGVAGAAYRNTVGRYSTVVLDKGGEALKRKALEGKTFVGRGLAKATLAASQTLATTSGDLRNTKFGKSLNLGKGRGQDGFQGDVKRKDDAITKDINEYGGASKETRAEINKHKKTIKEQQKAFKLAHYSNNKVEARRASRRIREAQDKLNKAEKKKNAEISAERAAYSQWLASRHPSNLWGLARINTTAYAQKNVAAKFAKNLKPAEDKEQESQRVSDMKDIVNETRNDPALKSKDEERSEIMKKTLKNVQDVAKMVKDLKTDPLGPHATEEERKTREENVETLNAIIPELTKKHLEAIGKNDEVTSDTINHIANTILDNPKLKQTHNFVLNARPNSQWYTGKQEEIKGRKTEGHSSPKAEKDKAESEKPPED